MLLWFDVEERYNATSRRLVAQAMALWFDVEERYNATHFRFFCCVNTLWFDVEERYNATCKSPNDSLYGCGLMQKKDITQPNTHATEVVTVVV